MKKDKDTSFIFEVVEEKGRNVIIEVSEEEYQRQISSGVPQNEALPAGRHVFRRGGFRERHPNFKLENVKINITDSKFSETDEEKKVA